VWVIDFNPFGDVTDSLLFTWEELTSGKNLSANQTQEDTTQQVVYTWLHLLYIKPCSNIFHWQHFNRQKCCFINGMHTIFY